MPRSMTKFKMPTVKHPLNSFMPIRNGQLAYHKYGRLATFANKTQAINKSEYLKCEGFDNHVTLSHPFLIIFNSIKDSDLPCTCKSAGEAENCDKVCGHGKEPEPETEQDKYVEWQRMDEIADAQSIGRQ